MKAKSLTNSCMCVCIHIYTQFITTNLEDEYKNKRVLHLFADRLFIVTSLVSILV